MRAQVANDGGAFDYSRQQLSEENKTPTSASGVRRQGSGYDCAESKPHYLWNVIGLTLLQLHFGLSIYTLPNIYLFTAMYAPDSNVVCLLLGIVVTHVLARCYDPSPAFPLPKYQAYRDSELLKRDFQLIGSKLEKLIADSKFDISSFSIEITTSQGTLWENHHTSKEKDPKRPGAIEITGNSVYRMASVTKCFTTLAILQQHIAGNLSLDDTVDMYLSDLSGSIPWKDITLKTLATQLSGIPRDCAT